MDIDIYARWKNQTPAERLEQMKARSSSLHGRIGYLSEAHRGVPHATAYLATEAFASSDGALIPAATLRQRLPEALRLCEWRLRLVYGIENQEDIQPRLRSFTDFVELCEEKERETGVLVRIIVRY